MSTQIDIANCKKSKTKEKGREGGWGGETGAGAGRVTWKHALPVWGGAAVWNGGSERVC